MGDRSRVNSKYSKFNVVTSTRKNKGSSYRTDVVVSSVVSTVNHCWGNTRKIRIITLTREEFLTRSSTQLGRKESEMLSANSTSPKKV
jgi:hypothetical protein